jgi:DNA-directed RNA polymerase specialized sigma24 family protein
VIRRAAHRLEDADPDVADDLVQEALIRLWELGPARYEPRDDDYVQSRMIWHMRFARRKESRHERRCSLRIPLRLL